MWPLGGTIQKGEATNVGIVSPLPILIFISCSYYIVKSMITNYYYLICFPLATYMDMKSQIALLYSKIKFEININNDELLESISKHVKDFSFKRRKGWITGWGGYYY
jgi:hypothetical protein